MTKNNPLLLKILLMMNFLAMTAAKPSHAGKWTKKAADGVLHLFSSSYRASKADHRIAVGYFGTGGTKFIVGTPKTDPPTVLAKRFRGSLIKKAAIGFEYQSKESKSGKYNMNGRFVLGKFTPISQVEDDVHKTKLLEHNKSADKGAKVKGIVETDAGVALSVLENTTVIR